MKKVDTRTPDDFIIEQLEAILKDAKEGKIISCACVFLENDLKSGNFFSKRYPVHLLGATSILEREMQDHLVDLRLHSAGDSY